MNMTQGGARQDRAKKEDAEDVILYAYLLIADLMIIYEERLRSKPK